MIVRADGAGVHDLLLLFVLLLWEAFRVSRESVDLQQGLATCNEISRNAFV